MKRYRQAANIASLTIDAGKWIWVIGTSLVFLQFLVFFGFTGEIFATGFVIVFQLLVVFVVGLLVTGFGWIQTSVPDTVISANPFLNEAERKLLMDRSLPTVEGPASAPQIPFDGWRCRCGQVNREEVLKCPNCYRAKDAII